MKKYIVIFATLILAFTSCSEYLDINYNPNSPAEDVITNDMIFPGAEMHIATQYGARMRIIGGYLVEHYNQNFGTSNYLDSFSKFYVTSQLSSGAYTSLMRGTIGNLQTVIEKGNAEGKPGDVLAATCLRAFVYQALVDCYENVPYTEAFGENTMPAYDNGEDIYAGLIEELKAAKANAGAGDAVCTNFLMPGQSAGAWIKFANSLLLKLYMRMGDTAGAASVVAENNFITSDVEFAGCWENKSTAANPYFSEEFWPGQQQNVVLNGALLQTMVSYNDNRLGAFFDPNGAGNFKGGISGRNVMTASLLTDGTVTGAAYYCRPAMRFNTPVSLLSVAEVEFFLAEYQAKAGNHSSAEAHYNAAIEASFASAGVGGAAAVIAACPYDSSNYMKCIGVQKWVALSGINNYEAYCELRRIKYPAINSVSGETFAASSGTDFSTFEVGTLYTPIDVYSEVGVGKLIQRWPYPTSSQSVNSNCPEFEGYSTPVFWAK